jgi:endonuclease-3
MEFDQWEKCDSNRKDAKRLFPEEIWNDLHLQIIWYGRNSPARGWSLEKILLRIRRKSVLDKYKK